MTLALVVLSKAALALFTTCAPFIGIQSMNGLVNIESAWNQYAIADVDGKRAYCVPWGQPTSCDYRTAVTIASDLLAKHHSISAGYAQINTVNWEHYGLNAYNVFNDCTNIAAGADILSKDYAVAALHFSPGDPALTQAFSMYNSGRFYAAMGYARQVIAAARNTPLPPISRPANPSQSASSAVRLLNPSPTSAPKLYTLLLAPKKGSP